MQVNIGYDRYLDLISDKNNRSNGILSSNTSSSYSGGERVFKKFVDNMKQFWANVGHFQKNITTLIQSRLNKTE